MLLFTYHMRNSFFIFHSKHVIKFYINRENIVPIFQITGREGGREEVGRKKVGTNLCATVSRAEDALVK